MSRKPSFEAVFDNPRPTIGVVEYDNELSMPMTEAVRKMGGMKGLFIPGITAEEFKNGSLEAVEDLISSGEVYDVTLRNTSTQPEQRWIPCEERLPEKKDYYLVTYDGEIHGDDGKRFTSIEYWTGKKWSEMTVYAWAPLPEPYKEGSENDG